jgi:hypothetical protein
MYTLRDEDGGRDLVIEHGLKQLEDQFSTIRKKKLRRQLELDRNEHFFMCAFMAAIHVRTKSQLKHLSNAWRHPLKMMEDMAEAMKTATHEQRQTMADLSRLHGTEEGLTMGEVREMVDNPVGTILVPMIQAEIDHLPKLDFAVFYTDTSPGFITSDAPCVWSDPEAYKRPPLYRIPALGYKTIEIILPISPAQCVFLNRRGMTGYQYAPADIVREANSRIRFGASEYYAVNQNIVDDFWFDPGIEPEDSWEKQQARNKKVPKTPERFIRESEK